MADAITAAREAIESRIGEIEESCEARQDEVVRRRSDGGYELTSGASARSEGREASTAAD